LGVRAVGEGPNRTNSQNINYTLLTSEKIFFPH
jgi:hypothetical protein